MKRKFYKIIPIKVNSIDTPKTYIIFTCPFVEYCIKNALRDTPIKACGKCRYRDTSVNVHTEAIESDGILS